MKKIWSYDLNFIFSILAAMNAFHFLNFVYFGVEFEIHLKSENNFFLKNINSF